MKAKKKFGQNFLINEEIVNKIINSINYEKYNQIIEVGPGTGALSKHLLKKCNPVLIEIDEDAVKR